MEPLLIGALALAVHRYPRDTEEATLDSIFVGLVTGSSRGPPSASSSSSTASRRSMLAESRAYKTSRPRVVNVFNAGWCVRTSVEGIPHGDRTELKANVQVLREHFATASRDGGLKDEGIPE